MKSEKLTSNLNTQQTLDLSKAGIQGHLYNEVFKSREASNLILLKSNRRLMFNVCINRYTKRASYLCEYDLTKYFKMYLELEY